jgi:hypothetical protein
MRAIALALISLAFAGHAWGATRLNAGGMTCAALQTAVQANGSAIVAYQSRAASGLYDRFVRNSQSCAYDESAEVSYVPTADTPACVLSRCVPDECGESNR